MVLPNESESSEVSKRKRRANRRNAKRSTGPRTGEGKKRSALNATTHGIFCSRLVLAGEDQTNLVVIREGYLQKLAPQDVVELALVDQIVNAQWRLMRAERAEADHLEQLQFQNRELARRKVGKFLKDYDLSDDLAAEEARDPDKDPATKALYTRMRAFQRADDVDMPADMLLCQAFMDRAGVIERMSRYEQRLHSTISRCMTDLEKLRGTKRSEWANLPPSPFLADPTDKGWPPDVVDQDDLAGLRGELEELMRRMQTMEAEEALEREQEQDPIVQNKPTDSAPVASPEDQTSCAEQRKKERLAPPRRVGLSSVEIGQNPQLPPGATDPVTKSGAQPPPTDPEPPVQPG